MMLDDFLVRAFLGGMLLAVAAGPLGCFVVWRRMAYFGDATAHAAIFGVTLSLAFSISIFAGVLFAALGVAILLALFSGRLYTADTMLGVAAHGALALGLVSVSFLTDVRVDLSSYLFGDILAVGQKDLLVIASGATFILLILGWRWRRLLLATLNEDLAVSEGLNARTEALLLVLLIATLVAVAIKIVGALLITAMLIIPAAAARPLARTPEGMAAMAIVMGMISVSAGLAASFDWDSPAGPTIIVIATVLFVATGTLSRLKRT